MKYPDEGLILALACDSLEIPIYCIYPMAIQLMNDLGENKWAKISSKAECDILIGLSVLLSVWFVSGQ